MVSALSPMRRALGLPVFASRMYSSGLTKPETTASPSPQLAFTTISSARAFIGLPTNITPETSASTIAWTTTAILGCSPSNPRP